MLQHRKGQPEWAAAVEEKSMSLLVCQKSRGNNLQFCSSEREAILQTWRARQATLVKSGGIHQIPAPDIGHRTATSTGSITRASTNISTSPVEMEMTDSVSCYLSVPDQLNVPHINKQTYLFRLK